MPDDGSNTPGPDDIERPPWPEEGEEGYDDWLDGPMPERGAGRGAWLAGRSKRKRAATPKEQRDGSGASVAMPAPQDTPAARLRHEMEHAALPSDRIRAADALARLERAELEEQSDEVALWLARRDTLLTIPPQQRLEWLLGVMREGSTGDDDGEWLAPPE